MDIAEKEKKLNLLNNKLIKEEEKVFNTIKKVKKYAEKLIVDGELSDINIALEVQGFKTEEDEDSFFTSKTNFLLIQLHDYDTYKKEDYTETLFKPFNGIKWNNPHCITFHDLCFHNDLTMEDILEISEIWIVVKTDYQFITKY